MLGLQDAAEKPAGVTNGSRCIPQGQEKQQVPLKHFQELPGHAHHNAYVYTEGWDLAKMRYANSFANGFTSFYPIGIGSVTSTAVITSTIAASATSKQAERHRSASATLVTLP